MQIFVKDIKGHILTLEVGSTDTIGDVKSKIQQKYGHPRYFQKILLNNERLEDDKTLADYKVENDSTLYIVMNYRGGMRSSDAINYFKAAVKDKDGNVSEQLSPDEGRTEANYTIQKESAIEDKEEISSNQKYIEDGSTLADYNIGKKSTIPMQISMRVVPSRKVTLELQNLDKIHDLKITTEKQPTSKDKKGIPLNQDCPDDDRTLAADYKLQKEYNLALKVTDTSRNLKITIQDIEGISGSAGAHCKRVEANGKSGASASLRALASPRTGDASLCFAAGLILYALLVLTAMSYHI